MSRLQIEKGVFVFLIWRGRFLLTQRDDKSTKVIHEPNKWCPITGKVDEDDSYLHTAIREVEEELLFTPRKLIPLGNTRRNNCIFLCRISDQESFEIGLGDEGQAYGFFSYEFVTDSSNRILFADAFLAHLENAPEVLNRVCVDKKFIPRPEELFLSPYKETACLVSEF